MSEPGPIVKFEPSRNSSCAWPSAVEITRSRSNTLAPTTSLCRAETGGTPSTDGLDAVVTPASCSSADWARAASGSASASSRIGPIVARIVASSKAQADAAEHGRVAILVEQDGRVGPDLLELETEVDLVGQADRQRGAEVPFAVLAAVPRIDARIGVIVAALDGTTEQARRPRPAQPRPRHVEAVRVAARQAGFLIGLLD